MELVDEFDGVADIGERVTEDVGKWICTSRSRVRSRDSREMRSQTCLLVLPLMPSAHSVQQADSKPAPAALEVSAIAWGVSRFVLMLFCRWLPNGRGL